MELKQGIITGCDKNMEKFLPWWFDHIQEHTDLPVAIFDYGLSEWGKKVANNVGQLITPQNIPLDGHHKKPTYPSYHKKGHTLYMYKPFALLQSPFEHTLWLDVDCKVQAHLDELFTSSDFQITKGSPTAQDWVRKHGVLKSQDRDILISSTLVCQKTCPVLKAWCEETFENSAHYPTEDVLLTELIASKNLNVSLFPSHVEMPWRSFDPDALILHYSGPFGKAAIIEEMLVKACGGADAR